MSKALDIALSDLVVGQCSQVTWHVTETELDQFAALSGDHNPLHMDADYAGDHGFAARVAHGFLLGAKLSGLIGMTLPGRRCLLLEQSLAYPNPVYPGDTVDITATVQDIHAELSLITLKVRATVQRDDARVTVGRGSATCKILY